MCYVWHEHFVLSFIVPETLGGLYCILIIIIGIKYNTKETFTWPEITFSLQRVVSIYTWQPRATMWR